VIWWRRLAWKLAVVSIKVVARLLWRLRIDWGAGFPEPPFVLAANHHSFLDPPLAGAVYYKPVRFLALSDLIGVHRSLDLALDVFEVIPIRRGKVPLSPMRTALEHLESGGVIGVFPEGTRHNRFDPSRAMPGAAWLAVRSGVPLVAMAVIGTDQVLGVENHLRPGRIRVVVGPAFHSTGTGRDAVDELTRRWARWTSVALSEGQVIEPASPVEG
jgi:1-acyl-sn-glycerol-3-phosphate acyltransferase